MAVDFLAVAETFAVEGGALCCEGDAGAVGVGGEGGGGDPGAIGAERFGVGGPGCCVAAGEGEVWWYAVWVWDRGNVDIGNVEDSGVDFFAFWGEGHDVGSLLGAVGHES